MPTLPSLITAILALEKAAADKERGTVDSLPGPPATEAKIAAAEKSRGRKFHRSYREFLKLHDGWKDFRWGMQLRPVAELTGSAYDPGYIEDMI
ncbi:MAG TPA: SMI1/KNR4 family protein, partial [Kofleriaceae bacterium]